MDHLNIFNQYSKSLEHEDVLTRAFLILLKNISVIQVMFFEMVREELRQHCIDSILCGGLSVERVYTQVSHNNEAFITGISERNLVSIIISDDRLHTDTVVQSDDRGARYDGVVYCDPNWVFIIENKPDKSNIWIEQLNPNISDKGDVHIIPDPCCLSWRKILECINGLLSKDLLSGVGKAFTEDFLQYVDSAYPEIRPYTKFDVCKDDIYLLNRKCISIMETYMGNDGVQQTVYYNKNWKKHYIESGVSTVKQIALDTEELNGDWAISLWMYAGDVMSSAREVYQNSNIEDILGLRAKEGFTITSNFHVAYQSTGLVHFKHDDKIEDYLSYWKAKKDSLKQIRKEDFEGYFARLVAEGAINESEYAHIKEKILSKKYDKLNICPGFLIKYTWSHKDAVDLDNIGRFEEDFNSKVKQVLNALG